MFFFFYVLIGDGRSVIKCSRDFEISKEVECDLGVCNFLWVALCTFNFFSKASPQFAGKGLCFEL